MEDDREKSNGDPCARAPQPDKWFCKSLQPPPPGWGAGTMTTRMTSKGALNWSIKTVTRRDGAASTKHGGRGPKNNIDQRRDNANKHAQVTVPSVGAHPKRKRQGTQNGRPREDKEEAETHIQPHNQRPRRKSTWTGIPPGQETHLEGKPTWTYNGNNHYYCTLILSNILQK